MRRPLAESAPAPYRQRSWRPQREIEAAEETHTLKSQRPACFAVGEHIARGFISELEGADGTFTTWRADATIAWAIG